MSHPRVLIASLAVLIFGSACISLPDIDSVQGDAGIPTPPTDSGHTPSDGGGEPDASTPTHLTVKLLAPSETAFTNDLVDVQVQVTGGTPDTVELLVDDQFLTTLATPYTYRWSTRPAAEGSHQLIAKATLGSKTFTSEPREVVVDRTPPEVVSRVPTPGAQDVWARQPIEVTFSESIKASTQTGDAARLTVGTSEVAATASLSADGKKLTVTPLSRIQVPNTVKLTLSASLTDQAGNALAIPSDTWTWNLPTVFPLGNLNALTGDTPASNPVLQIDRKGNPVVAWLETSATNPDLRDVHTRIWNGLTWQNLGSQTSALPFVLSMEKAQLDLQVDQDDRPIAAWVHLDDPNVGRIVVRRWTGTEWQSVGEPLETTSTADSERPYPVSLQIAQDSRPVVAWESHNYVTQASQLFVMQWSGSKWEQAGTPIALVNTNGRARPSLALESTNKPVVAWADYAGGGVSGIQVSRWTGTGWEFLGPRVEANTQPSTATENPSLLLAAEATPIIAWSEFDGNTTNAHVRRWVNNAWEPLGGTLSALPGKTPVTRPRLQMDASRNLFIMWAEANESGVFRGYISRWTGSEWEELGAPLNIDAYGIHEWSFKISASGTPFIASLNPGTTNTTTVDVTRYNH